MTAGSLGTQISLGVKYLLEDFGHSVSLRMLWDNKSSLTIAQLGGTWRSRHYAVRAQAVRELLHFRALELDFVGTELQWADVLTKALAGPAIAAFIAYFPRRRAAVGLFSSWNVRVSLFKGAAPIGGARKQSHHVFSVAWLKLHTELCHPMPTQNHLIHVVGQRHQ